MAAPCEKSDSSRPEKPAPPARDESASNAALRDYLERAGSAYFRACARLARAITRFKGRRKKR